MVKVEHDSRIGAREFHNATGYHIDGDRGHLVITNAQDEEIARFNDWNWVYIDDNSTGAEPVAKGAGGSTSGPSDVGP